MDDRESLLRALLLSHRYTVELTRIATSTLGGNRGGNLDVRVLLTIHLMRGSTVGRVSTALGVAGTAVSRSLRHLVDDGLVARRPSPHDGRSSLLALTRKGRARVDRFQRALEDYFQTGAPLVKEVLDLRHLDIAAGPPVTPLDAVIELTGAGFAYVQEVTAVLTPFGVTDTSQRYTLTLLLERGQVRPTQLAHDLALSTSGTSEVLDRLEGARLVTRSHDDHGDRRAVLIHLTDRGEKAASQQLAVFTRHADVLCHALAVTLNARKPALSAVTSR